MKCTFFGPIHATSKSLLYCKNEVKRQTATSFPSCGKDVPTLGTKKWQDAEKCPENGITFHSKG
jgi:hypothetical protein